MTSGWKSIKMRWSSWELCLFRLVLMEKRYLPTGSEGRKEGNPQPGSKRWLWFRAVCSISNRHCNQWKHFIGPLCFSYRKLQSSVLYCSSHRFCWWPWINLLNIFEGMWMLLKLDRNFQVVPRNELLQISNQSNKQTQKQEHLLRSYKIANYVSTYHMFRLPTQG